LEDQTTVEGGSGDEVVRAIDLHSNNNVTVVIDEQDRMVYQKRLLNDLPLITPTTIGLPQLEEIVVESRDGCGVRGRVWGLPSEFAGDRTGELKI
jgi:hypothetical protein